MTFLLLPVQLVLSATFVSSTIDVTLTQYNHLANHLLPIECRKLIAALHFKSYNKPNSLDEAERKVPEDVPCLHQLLYWNNKKGQGAGETHEVVLRALRQIDRPDLAEWLGKTVFNELGQELQQGLERPFRDFLEETTKKPELGFSSARPPSEDVWSYFDTIAVTLILFMTIGTVVILVVILAGKKPSKKEAKKTRSLPRSPYKYSIVSDDESREENLTFLEVFSANDNLIKIFYDVSRNLSPHDCRKLKDLLVGNDGKFSDDEDSCLYTLLRWDEEFKMSVRNTKKILEKSLRGIHRYDLAESLRRNNKLQSTLPGYSVIEDVSFGYPWSYFDVLTITITVLTILGTSFIMVSFLVARLMKKRIKLKDKRSGFIPRGPYDFSVLYDYYTEEESSDDSSN